MATKTELEVKVETLEKSLNEMMDAIRRLSKSQTDTSQVLSSVKQDLLTLMSEINKVRLEISKKSESATVYR